VCAWDIKNEQQEGEYIKEVKKERKKEKKEMKLKKCTSINTKMLCLSFT
jgi:hypothetical protein